MTAPVAPPAAGMPAKARHRAARVTTLALVGALLQALAIWLAIGHAPWPAQTGYRLGLALLSHTLASAVLAQWIRRSVPPSFREPQRPTYTLLFAHNWLVPTFAFWFRAAVALGLRWQRLKRAEGIVVRREVAFDFFRPGTGVSSRGGQVRRQLKDPNVPTAARLSSLLGIQDAPARVTAGLLREMLADPVDDIRLLAYGMVDSKEKAISHRVFAENKALEHAAGDDSRYAIHKRIAELNWELIYQNLVQGDVRIFSAEQAKQHARAALDLRPEDGGLWYLLAKVELVRNDLDATEHALAQAQAAGLEREGLIPWLAECAFMRRNYTQVRDLFRELSAVPGTLRLAAVYHYWIDE